MNGFISLHRRIIEWEWYTEPDTFRVFIHLLMMANHAPAKVRGRESIKQIFSRNHCKI